MSSCLTIYLYLSRHFSAIKPRHASILSRHMYFLLPFRRGPSFWGPRAFRVLCCTFESLSCYTWLHFCVTSLHVCVTQVTEKCKNPESELWKSEAGVVVYKDRGGLRIDLATGQNWSKEVWKILPSYEELRRGAIGRGKEVEVMSIRCHVN